MGRISMPQGKGSQMHNRRDYDKIGRPVPDNIDVSRSPENIVLVDKDIQQAYDEIFGEALAEFNGKQKRADRKIDSYYDHIQKSKNGEKPFYEDIVQWGQLDDFTKPETRELAKTALVKYVKGFEERNPNLRLIGAYIHMDEASPHLHLDYIPVASGYSRGLAIRNSLDKAMKQMGFQPENESRKNNATKLWKERERAVFGEICRDLGLDVEVERKARGSLSVEEYKEARHKMTGEINQELKSLNDTAAQLRAAAAVSNAVSAIQPEKTITGAIKGVTVDQINDLKLLAASEAAARERVVQLEQENASLRRNIPTVREHLSLIGEVQDLKAENSRLQDALDQEKSFSKGLFEGITKALIFLEKMLPKNLQHLLKQVKDIIRESVPGLKLPHRSSKDREER